jgi:hypothetical protein
MSVSRFTHVCARACARACVCDGRGACLYVGWKCVNEHSHIHEQRENIRCGTVFLSRSLCCVYECLHRPLCMLGGNVYMNTRTSTNKGKTYVVVLSFSRARYVVFMNVCIGLCAWRVYMLEVKLAVKLAMPMRKYLHTA